MLQICSISLNCRPYRPRQTALLYHQHMRLPPSSLIASCPSACLPFAYLPILSACLPSVCKSAPSRPSPSLSYVYLPILAAYLLSVYLPPTGLHSACPFCLTLVFLSYFCLCACLLSVCLLVPGCLPTGCLPKSCLNACFPISCSSTCLLLCLPVYLRAFLPVPFIACMPTSCLPLLTEERDPAARLCVVASGPHVHIGCPF